MHAEDVKALRDELACSMSELARAIEVPVELVVAWEAGERFPTKKHVQRMESLRARGPDAIPKRPARPRSGARPAPTSLRDPALWELIRKLIAHPELFREARRIAESYSDPD